MSADGFYFNAKQWLGDDAILLMDWDARAMHLHLMCIAWQQKPPGRLPADDHILRRWVGSPSAEDWNNRLKPQILKGWTLEEGFWHQEGLSREWERQTSKTQKRKAAANARWGKEKNKTGSETDASGSTPLWSEPLAEDPFLSSVLGKDGEPLTDPAAGFSLSKILRVNALFLEKATKDERANIWSVGVGMLKHAAFDDNKARAYLGKLISEFGEKVVAEAIAQLSLKALPPADAKTYLIGILKGEKSRRKGRGRVAL